MPVVHVVHMRVRVRQRLVPVPVRVRHLGELLGRAHGVIGAIFRSIDQWTRGRWSERRDGRYPRALMSIPTEDHGDAAM